MSAQPEQEPPMPAAEAPDALPRLAVAAAPDGLDGAAIADAPDGLDGPAIADAPGGLDAPAIAEAPGRMAAPEVTARLDLPAGAEAAEAPVAPLLAANDAEPAAPLAADAADPPAPPAADATEPATPQALDAGAAVEAPAPPDPADWDQALLLAEALIFAADRPITPQRLQPVLPERCDARAVLAALAEQRAAAPVRLVEVAGGWAFRTAPDLAPQLTRVVEVPRRLPRAAMETLAIIAYHQPVTRAEIEEIRGAALAQTTLESLLEMGLVQPRGRKEVPGRPSLWGTTTRFLEQFGLRSLNELPRREELVNEPTLPFAAPPAAA